MNSEPKINRKRQQPDVNPLQYVSKHICTSIEFGNILFDMLDQ